MGSGEEPAGRDGQKARSSVRQRLAIMLALAMAPAGALAIVDSFAAYRAAYERADLDFMLETAEAARLDRDTLLGVRAGLEVLAATPSVRELGPDCDATLAAYVDSRPGATLAAVTGPDGSIRCASRADALGVDTSISEGFVDFQSNPRFVITSLDKGIITGERVIVVTTPIPETRGDGVYALNLSLRPASFALRDEAVSPQMRILIGRDGRPLALGPPSEQDWRPSGAALAGWLGPEPRVFEATGNDGTLRVFVCAPLIDDAAWLLAGAAPEAVRPAGFAVAAPAVLAPFLMWLAGVLVAYFTIDRLVVRHVVQLSRLARAFGHGRLRLRPKGMETAPKEVALLARDMGEMAEKLDARQRAVTEAAETNRALLFEVYHRVKNNLQMIASLLSMEARRATTPETVEALGRVRERVQSVALVHATLYGSEDVGRLRLDRLAEQILTPLAAGSENPPEDDVDLQLALDPILATAERATPFALFLNEAGAKAARHARLAGRAARVHVRLTRGAGGGFDLVVANDAGRVNGHPAPEDALGRRLMEGFARQLGAIVEVGREGDRHVVRLSAPPGPAGPPD